MATNAVDKFERGFANWLGVANAFAFWKGRVAMFAILKCLGICEGNFPVTEHIAARTIALPFLREFNRRSGAMRRGCSRQGDTNIER